MTAVPEVAAVRAFSRFYTAIIGALEEGLLQTSYSVTEARVLYELAQRPATDLVDLRRELSIDAGYASRIVQRFEADGMIERERSERDARRQVLRLTARGRDVFTVLDRRSDAQVSALLAPVPAAQRRRLVDAMTRIRTVLGPTPAEPRVVLRAPGPGDHGWVIARHGAVYHEQFGWDDRFEALVAGVVAEFMADHDPVREAAWIAELDGEPAGSVYCVAKDDTTAKLRLLLVEPWARGHGIGARLVTECVDFARAAGYEHMVLWTNDVLVSARRIYEAAGFTLDREEAHHSFGHDLVGQYWSLDL